MDFGAAWEDIAEKNREGAKDAKTSHHRTEEPQIAQIGAD